MTDETELAFHPHAAANFRERGEHLLASLKPIEEKPSRAEFKADSHPTEILTENEIFHIGPRHTVNPLTMEVSEIAFHTPEGLIGFAREECAEAEKLSEAIQQTSSFKPRISHKFVRHALIDWLEARVCGKSSDDLPVFLLELARCSMHTFDIWVPLANLALEHEIKLDPIRVRPISKETLDNWFDSLRRDKTPEYLARIDPNLERQRADVQGLAAACIALRAERQFAIEKAIEKAEEAAAVFRLFHPANSQPGAAFYCRTLGRENVESYSVLVVEDGEFEGRSGAVMRPYPDTWELGGERLAHLEGDLIPVRDLLRIGKRTEFQREALDAIFLYTRSTMTRDPVDKLVFIFSALESILLKNETEPIQTHIGDRLAFVLGSSIEERRRIVQLVRVCYGFRSKFLHHGRTIDDFASLGEFMRYAWVFFMRLAKYAHDSGTRADFIETIETRKYSAP